MASKKVPITTELPSVRKQVVGITRPLSQLPPELDSLTHTKALFLFQLLAGKGVQAGQLYEAPIEVVRDALRCRNDAHLAEELERLDMKISAEKWSPTKRGWIRFVSSCVWGDGVVQWAFDPHFIALLEDRSRGWRFCDFEVLVSFRSLFALRIYLYCAPYVGGAKQVQPPPLTNPDLRALLGLSPNAYPVGEMGQLVYQVRRSCREITDAKDGFKVGYVKEGRGANTWHHFIIEEGPKQKRLVLSGAGSAKPVTPKPVAIEDDEPHNADLQKWLARQR